MIVDTSGVEGVTRVHILSGSSRFVATTMNISKELSRTGELIRVHEDPATFAEALARATGEGPRARPAR